MFPPSNNFPPLNIFTLSKFLSVGGILPPPKSAARGGPPPCYDTTYSKGCKLENLSGIFLVGRMKLYS